MRISKALAVSVSGLALAATAALPAAAGANHPATGKNGTLPSTLSAKSAHIGQKLTLKVHGAKKKTSYICVFAIVKGKQNSPFLGNTTNVTSSKKGAFKCTLTFKAFSGQIGSKTYHCPPTAADKKAHIKCGFATADPADKNSNAIQYFTAKK
jgi:hypothetical protein